MTRTRRSRLWHTHAPFLPFWPELPRRSLAVRSVEQTFGAFADLVHPRLSGYGDEVAPGRLTAPAAAGG
jgi:hypothetical protein